MRKKRGKFRTFICSLMPGAAEMYMGFMKYGISLITLFLLSFLVPTVFGLNDAFILVAILIWFYSFFHARNLASCSEEEFKGLQDTYVWNDFLEGREVKINNPAFRKWGAIVLIVIGISQLWNTVTSLVYNLVPDYMWDEVYMVMNEVPQVLMAIVIIFIGFKLIAGKKEELNGDGK